MCEESVRALGDYRRKGQAPVSRSSMRGAIPVPEAPPRPGAAGGFKAAIAADRRGGGMTNTRHQRSCHDGDVLEEISGQTSRHELVNEDL